MSDIYLNAITPTFYEPGGIDYAKNVILYRKIAYGTIYIIPYTSFNADGTISDTGPFWLGFMNADGKICQQNGRQAILQTGYYHFFVSRESISDARIVIRRNMCSAAIAITEGQNQAVYLPFFPEIQTLIDGRTVKGKMREPGIALLKRFENPPIKNGMIGLHTPGDGTVTYGYGYVVFNEQDESNREKKKKAKEKLPELRRTGDYPDMTLTQADAHLRSNKVLGDRIDRVNRRIRNVNDKIIDNNFMLFTANQFDALVSIEFNAGDSGPLMRDIHKIRNSNSPTKFGDIYNTFIKYKITYSGLLKRRKAEAMVFLAGVYDENFTYP